MNFKPIIFNGEKTNYIINEHGTVINIKTNKVLKPKYEIKRYFISICVHGRVHKKTRARWIALAFIPIPDGYDVNELEADHIDGNPTNDTLDNIQWLTRKENSDKEYLVENKYFRGEKNGNAKISDEMVIKILEDTILGFKPKYLAKKYNVSRDTIVSIRTGQSWVHLSKNYDLTSFVSKRKDIVHYSQDIKEDIYNILSDDINIKAKRVCELLNIEKTHKIECLINSIRRKIKNKESSTTIENKDCYLYIDINL